MTWQEASAAASVCGVMITLLTLAVKLPHWLLTRQSEHQSKLDDHERRIVALEGHAKETTAALTEIKVDVAETRSKVETILDLLREFTHQGR